MTSVYSNSFDQQQPLDDGEDSEAHSFVEVMYLARHKEKKKGKYSGAKKKLPKTANETITTSDSFSMNSSIATNSLVSSKKQRPMRNNDTDDINSKKSNDMDDNASSAIEIVLEDKEIAQDKQQVKRASVTEERDVPSVTSAEKENSITLPKLPPRRSKETMFVPVDDMVVKKSKSIKTRTTTTTAVAVVAEQPVAEDTVETSPLPPIAQPKRRSLFRNRLLKGRGKKDKKTKEKVDASPQKSRGIGADLSRRCKLFPKWNNSAADKENDLNRNAVDTPTSESDKSPELEPEPLVDTPVKQVIGVDTSAFDKNNNFNSNVPKTPSTGKSSHDSLAWLDAENASQNSRYYSNYLNKVPLQVQVPSIVVPQENSPNKIEIPYSDTTRGDDANTVQYSMSPVNTPPVPVITPSKSVDSETSIVVEENAIEASFEAAKNVDTAKPSSPKKAGAFKNIGRSFSKNVLSRSPKLSVSKSSDSETSPVPFDLLSAELGVKAKQQKKNKSKSKKKMDDPIPIVTDIPVPVQQNKKKSKSKTVEQPQQVVPAVEIVNSLQEAEKTELPQVALCQRNSHVSELTTPLAMLNILNRLEKHRSASQKSIPSGAVSPVIDTLSQITERYKDKDQELVLQQVSAWLQEQEEKHKKSIRNLRQEKDEKKKQRGGRNTKSKNLIDESSTSSSDSVSTSFSQWMAQLDEKQRKDAAAKAKASRDAMFGEDSCVSSTSTNLEYLGSLITLPSLFSWLDEKNGSDAHCEEISVESESENRAKGPPIRQLSVSSSFMSEDTSDNKQLLQELKISRSNDLTSSGSESGEENEDEDSLSYDRPTGSVSASSSSSSSCSSSSESSSEVNTKSVRSRNMILRESTFDVLQPGVEEDDDDDESDDSMLSLPSIEFGPLINPPRLRTPLKQRQQAGETNAAKSQKADARQPQMLL